MYYLKYKDFNNIGDRGCQYLTRLNCFNL